jgi:type II secretory pathway predicted ATPase ExeA
LKESKDIAYAYVFNGRLSPAEFLHYIVSDFGLPAAGKNKGELLLDLGQFLISRGSKKQTTVLIVDEAQLLSVEILEEIRLLSNLETADDKLLQIVLVGQPELDEKLDSLCLRQLKQRIALRAHLAPLDPDETREYIQKRLEIAGADLQGAPIFPAETAAAVYQHSHGLPRLINTVCENALIAAYALAVHSVTPEIIDDVAREFRLNTTEQNGNSGIANMGGYLRPPTGAMLDIFSRLRDTGAGCAGSSLDVAAEQGEHELHI